jgi:hypothetical protein
MENYLTTKMKSTTQILQIPLSSKMKEELDHRTKPVGISNTAYIKVLIAKDLGLLPDTDFLPGNLFNADRDNNGKGVPIEDMRKMLNVSP